jgi:hypothetical protein
LYAYAVGGNDIVEYPVTVQPKSYGTFTGALMFIAKTASHQYRYNYDMPA